MEITAEEIYGIVTEEANVPRESLQDDAQLASLGIASLDVIGISFLLEDRFGLVLDPNDLTVTSTVGDLVEKIQGLAKAKSPA